MHSPNPESPNFQGYSKFSGAKLLLVSGRAIPYMDLMYAIFTYIYHKKRGNIHQPWGPGYGHSLPAGGLLKRVENTEV